MRPHTAFLVGAALALAACSSRTPNSPSSTSLTAAELRAIPPPTALVVPRQPPIDTTAPIEEWRGRYPQAAEVLDFWVEKFPDASSRVLSWSVDEPERFEVLVMWAITLPHESLQTFLNTRSSWQSLQTLQDEDPHALAAFLHWVREARPAAEELAMRPGGLAVVATRTVASR